jgi:hypothetical protein
MRASAPLAVRAVALAFAVALTGCAANVRPDAEVALAVERTERAAQAERKAIELTALASADDDLPVAPAATGPAGKTAARPGPDPSDLSAAVPASAGAEAAGATFVSDEEAFNRFFPAASRETFRPASERPRTPVYGFDDADGSENPGAREGKRGLPNLRFDVFRLTLNGQPINVKCSIKNKHLMFGMKIPL